MNKRVLHKLDPQTVKKVENENKFLNRSNHDIELVDINWNIESQRLDGFHVNGHFRLQPCGEGNKKRRLIWIKDFQKEGYTKRAKTIFNNSLMHP